MPIAMMARLGSARPTLAALIATNDPRCRCPSHSPIGSAISSETPIAAPLSSRCSTVFVSSRSRLFPMNLKALTKSLTGGLPPAPTA